MILDNTDWLSSIPKHWEVKRLKDVSSLNPSYDGADLEGDVSFVPMEALRYDDIQRQTIPFDEAKGSYTFFGDGDVLVAKVTPCFENGNIAVATDLVQGVGFGSSEIFTVRANTGICSRFLFYFMRTADFMDKACSTMCGVGGLKRISPKFMRSASVVVPPINEQEKIVSYLDEKIAAINATIAARDEELKLLKKFKQSKIAEVVTHGLTPNVPTKSSPLGEIPAHWEVARIKRVLKELESGKREDDGKEEVLSIGGEHIQDGEFYLEHKMFVSEDTYSSTRGKIQRGDILIVKDGATIGKCMYVDDMPEPKMLLNEHVYRLACTSKYSNLYFYYVIASQFSQDWFWSRNMSSAQESIIQNTLLTLPIAIPPLDEQLEIAKYLNEECKKIDKKCKLIDEQIKKLQLLKRALINEVVTGKRQLA